MINRKLNSSLAILCILSVAIFQSNAQQVDPIPLADSVVLPELPEEHKNASGKVSLIVAVAPDGVVASVNILSSSDPALNDSTISAIKQWQFTPAYRDELPVIGMFQHTFRFEEGENLFGQKLWKILNNKSKPKPVASVAPVEKKAAAPKKQPVAKKPVAVVSKQETKPKASTKSKKREIVAKTVEAKPVAKKEPAAPVVKATPIAKAKPIKKAAPIAKAKPKSIEVKPVEIKEKSKPVVVVPHVPRNSPPAPLTEITPQLPNELKVIKGQVQIRIDIDENGIVQKAFAQSSSHEELEAYTLETVKKWEFEPAYKDDKPIASKLILPILFPGQDKAPNLGEIPKVDLIRSLAKPIAVRKTVPELPESLSAESGSATIKFVVTKEGYVSYAAVGNASHPEFGKSALEAIYSWKFKPALNDGKPIDSQFSQVFQFTGGASQLKPDAWDKQPIVEHSPMPRMRSSLKSSNGFVLVHLRLDQQGNVTEARVMESTNPKLEKPTIEASYKWKFTPGKKEGRSIESNIIIPFIYPLANS